MRVIVAIVGSLLVHALLATLLAWALVPFSPPSTFVKLDLSSVELSFSEKERDSRPLDALPACAAHTPHFPTGTQEGDPRLKTPAVETTDLQFPSDILLPAEIILPEAITEAEQFESTAPMEPAPEQARLDALDKLANRLKALYPKWARREGVEGSVLLGIKVDVLGVVAEIRILESSGIEDFDKAAVKAFLSAKFIPATVNGVAIESTIRQPVQFKLTK